MEAPLLTLDNAPRTLATPLPAARRAPVPAFADIYRLHFNDVCAWLRALGIPASEREDVAQEVFVVVERRLARFDGENLAGWLYRIASLCARNQKRMAWWKNLFHRQVPLPEVAPVHPGPGPLESAERREQRRALESLLARLSEKHRAALILFEIEGYSGDEIASLQGIPVATVWTRLHHARRELLALLEKERSSVR